MGWLVVILTLRLVGQSITLQLLTLYKTLTLFRRLMIDHFRYSKGFLLVLGQKGLQLTTENANLIVLYGNY